MNARRAEEWCLQNLDFEQERAVARMLHAARGGAHVDNVERFCRASGIVPWTFELVEPEHKTARAEIHAALPLTAEEQAALIEARRRIFPAPPRALLPVPPPVFEDEPS